MSENLAPYALIAYVGTTKVLAIPMTRGDYNNYRGWQIPADEDPNEEGYLVEYVDGGKPNDNRHKGYISWSPKDVFEHSYKQGGMGQVSDGYHTFDELYDHRMKLFSVVCRTFQGAAWKSKLHHDGTMYDDYFIVGIETKKGQFTYHYHMKDWDMFPVQERERAPEWDGHTANDIDRLFSLI